MLPSSQRRLDLVEEAERRRLEPQHREQNRNRCQRALAAGEQRKHLQLLSRRLGDNLNAAAEHVLFIHQPQSALPPPKSLTKVSLRYC